MHLQVQAFAALQTQGDYSTTRSDDQPSGLMALVFDASNAAIGNLLVGVILNLLDLIFSCESPA
jgi:hypothetical protein